MAIDPQRALRRSIGVARLDTATIEEVEADTSATAEAGVVVVVSSIIGSVGSLFVDGLGGFLSWIAILIVGWFVWAWLSAFIAEKLFDVRTTDIGEMQRAIGYASAPRAIGLIPYLGFVAGIWTLVAFIVAIRQAGEMTTGQAIITALVGLIPAALAIGIVSAIL